MDTLKTKGIIDFVIKDVNGNVRDSWTITNTITNTGKAAFAGLAGNTGSVSAFTYLALGTGATSPASSQTALTTEISANGFSRASATVSRVTTTETNDTLQLVKTWTATGSQTVQEIGVFNAASSGIMSARALTTSKSFVNGEQFQATYKIIFS